MNPATRTDKFTNVSAETKTSTHSKPPDESFMAFSDGDDDPKEEEKAGIVEDDQNAESLAPWAEGRTYDQSSFLFDLHEELLDFYDFMRPTDEEHNARECVYKRVGEVASSLWPGCNVQPFGSFATKLYLPMSDIDLVIFDSKANPAQAIELLAHELKQNGLVSFVECIPQARIPIVKFTDKASGIRVDVCFDTPGGLETAKLTQEVLETYRQLRPLTFFLKYFLQWRKLNDTYQGGVGSFMLQLMVVSMLQLHPVRQSKKFWRNVDSEISLGGWLVSFFELYGKEFNYLKVGISIRDGGSYYRKDRRDRLDKARPYLLSIENPLEPDLDVGKNSYMIIRVRRAFQYGYDMLLARDEKLPRKYPTLLSRLVSVRDETLLNRRRIDLPRHISAGSQTSSEKDCDVVMHRTNRSVSLSSEHEEEKNHERPQPQSPMGGRKRKSSEIDENSADANERRK
eukprot:274498_1